MPLLAVLIIILLFISTVVGVIVYYKSTPEGRAANAQIILEDAKANVKISQTLKEASEINKEASELLN